MATELILYRVRHYSVMKWYRTTCVLTFLFLYFNTYDKMVRVGSMNMLGTIALQ